MILHNTFLFRGTFQVGIQIYDKKLSWYWNIVNLHPYACIPPTLKYPASVEFNYLKVESNNVNMPG